MRSNLIDIEVTVVVETEKAFKLTSDNTGNTEWVPKSLVELSYRGSGSEAILTIPEPIAIEKGYI